MSFLWQNLGIVEVCNKEDISAPREPLTKESCPSGFSRVAQTGFFLGNKTFSHLVGPSERFYTHEKLPCVGCKVYLISRRPKIFIYWTLNFHVRERIKLRRTSVFCEMIQ